MRRTAILATTVAALALASCGGGESNENLSYSDFSEATNEICREQIPALRELTSQLTGDAAKDEAALAEAAEKTKAYIEDIQALEQPEELTEAVTERNAIVNEQYERLTQAQELAEAGDQKAYKDFLTDPKINGENQALASAEAEATSKLGADDCV